jgi:cysteine desulfurase
MAKAFTIAREEYLREHARLTTLHRYFLEELKKKVPNISLNGSLTQRVPGNINISIYGVEGESLVLFLDHNGIACSTGSACSSSDLNPSHVLLALGIPLALAHSNIRLSLGRYTRKTDIDYTIKILAECIARIRAMSTIS